MASSRLREVRVRREELADYPLIAWVPRSHLRVLPSAYQPPRRRRDWQTLWRFVGLASSIAVGVALGWRWPR